MFVLDILLNPTSLQNTKKEEFHYTGISELFRITALSSNVDQLLLDIKSIPKVDKIITGADIDHFLLLSPTQWKIELPSNFA